MRTLGLFSASQKSEMFTQDVRVYLENGTTNDNSFWYRSTQTITEDAIDEAQLWNLADEFHNALEFVENGFARYYQLFRNL